MPTDYINLTEAADMLGVTRQRLSHMVRDGDIAHIRPWPRSVLVKTTDVEAWQAGERVRQPVHKTAARQYVLDRTEADSVDEVNLHTLHSLLYEFISDRRDDLNSDNRRLWAEGMVGILAGSRR